MTMSESLFSLACGPAADVRLSVLIFHRVLAAPDPLFPGEIDARAFAAICGWLRDWCNVLPLPEALRLLSIGRLPARACAITFDDGYADNHEVALPILRAHGLSATFFIATGFLDGGRMWNDSVIEALRRTRLASLDARDILGEQAGAALPLDGAGARRAAIDQLLRQLKYLPPPERLAATERLLASAGVAAPTDLMMTSDQVRQLHRAGMQIGAHTVHHPILARLPDGQARDEIVAGKTTLERLLDEPVRLFAYPNGKPTADYSAATVALARGAGFDAAFSTAWGAADASTDRFQLPRFTPWDRSRLRFGLRLAHNWRRRQTVPALLAC